MRPMRRGLACPTWNIVYMCADVGDEEAVDRLHIENVPEVLTLISAKNPDSAFLFVAIVLYSPQKFSRSLAHSEPVEVSWKALREIQHMSIGHHPAAVQCSNTVSNCLFTWAKPAAVEVPPLVPSPPPSLFVCARLGASNLLHVLFARGVCGVSCQGEDTTQRF